MVTMQSGKGLRSSQEITVIGAGYVGLTTAACLSAMGHQVTCVEKDSVRLSSLVHGRLPFFEPSLGMVVDQGIRRKTLHLTDDLEAAVRRARFVFIAVGTPPLATGAPDLRDFQALVPHVVQSATSNPIVIIKSTVPVGTTDWLTGELAARSSTQSIQLVYNPEFLREGTAVHDFFHPYRVILGTRHPRAAEAMTELYRSLGSPVVVTDPRTAEMIKYASNAFLATKISFINEMAMICESVGADISGVATGMGIDPRIGPHFLKAGIGFGGSCLPKDVRALTVLAREHNIQASILRAVLEVNETQRRRFVEKVEQAVGSIPGTTLAVFGLAFKGRTSDVRESPALDIARRLFERGAVIRAFDPAAESEAAADLPAAMYCPDPYEAAAGADAILLLTDWPEFEQLDWARLKHQVRSPIVLDGRGLGGREKAQAAGFRYLGPHLEEEGSVNRSESGSPPLVPSGISVAHPRGRVE